ncbi:MAG: Serine protease Do-like HtrA [Syntrophomonadaceae bacterium]|nr:Serine protease Do-like HtrA [Bacillota bacterium]
MDVAPGSSFPIIKHKAYIGSVHVGEDVLAFGSPLGLVGTVTRGIVGAKRELSLSFGVWKPDVLVIQHNAAIAPGSSGGPLVNLYGEWIGVNTMGYVGLGFSFAVPADHYYWLAKQENYSLRDDWFSYYTEDYYWHEEWEKIVLVINEAMAAPWGQRKIDLLNRSIPMLQALREEVADYQSLYPEIQNLHRLYLNKLDTRLAYDLLLLDAQTNRALWSQSTAEMLWNNYIRAHEAYNAERRRITALFPLKY